MINIHVNESKGKTNINNTDILSIIEIIGKNSSRINNRDIKGTIDPYTYSTYTTLEHPYAWQQCQLKNNLDTHC